MPNLRVTEIKAFVRAKDFELSKQFYKDAGFTMASDGGRVAYFRFFETSASCCKTFASSHLQRTSWCTFLLRA